MSTPTEPTLDLTWRGMPIGQMLNPVRDMWYLEGEWAPAATPHAVAFKELASALVAKAVMADPRKGTRVELHGEGNRGIDALVLSLTGQQLLIRCVYDRAAVEMLKRDVR